MKDWQWLALAGLVLVGLGGAFVVYRRLSDSGVRLIESEEAFRATPYPDEAGLMTIGYGHKIKPGEHFTSITEAQGVAILRRDVADAEAAVNRFVKVPVSQTQFDALTSFVYNVGADAFAGSTLLRLLNAGNAAGAAAEFDRWNHVHKNGVLVASAGLTNRRARERALFEAVA